MQKISLVVDTCSRNITLLDYFIEFHGNENFTDNSHAFCVLVVWNSTIAINVDPTCLESISNGSVLITYPEKLICQNLLNE